MNGPRQADRASGGPAKVASVPSVRLPLAERKRRLLDEIARDRIRMQQAAGALTGPLRKIDSVRGRLSGSGQWLYPLAPVIALLAFRFRPGLGSLTGLATRAWGLWRLYQRFR
jgi:hypothetical protein